MHRLIIHLKEPLNTSFCEGLVALLGNCDVIPFTENYCVIEGFKMDNSLISFEKLLQLMKQNANRSFLASLKGDLGSQLQQLDKCPENSFLSEIEPTKTLFWSMLKVNNELWCLLPWEEPEFDFHEE